MTRAASARQGEAHLGFAEVRGTGNGPPSIDGFEALWVLVKHRVGRG